MSGKRVACNALHRLRVGMASLALFPLIVGTSTLNGQTTGDNNTSTPIKHVIVIIGENRSFDHVFATYVPQHGEVWNLLSEGIVNADGTPGPNFSQFEQNVATDQAPDTFLLTPSTQAFPSNILPAPLVGGPKDSYVTGDSMSLAQQSEIGLPTNYYQYLISGGTG